jgi:integrase
MPVEHLTERFIATVKSRVDRVDWFDTLVPGLALRVGGASTVAETKAWSLHYRNKAGKQRRFTLGRYPTVGLAKARAEARRKLVEVHDGGDPAESRRQWRATDAFAQLCETYMERHAKANKKSWREDDRLIRRELLPVLGGFKATEVRRRDVITLLDAIVSRPAPVLANRVKALVHKIFVFAISRDVVDANPVSGIARPASEKARERVLTDDEIRTLFTTLDAEPPKIRLLFKLLLLTAQRRNEVAGLPWSELDLDRSVWTLSGERAKNGRTHLVPLVGEALRLLREWREIQPEDADYVFPGGKKGQPLGDLKKPLGRIRRISAVNFRPHDLRRTAATRLSELGVPRAVTAKLLNHIEPGVTAQIYDRHSYDAEKRAALLKWDRRLHMLVTGETAPRVIELAG